VEKEEIRDWNEKRGNGKEGEGEDCNGEA